MGRGREAPPPAVSGRCVGAGARPSRTAAGDAAVRARGAGSPSDARPERRLPASRSPPHARAVGSASRQAGETDGDGAGVAALCQHHLDLACGTPAQGRHVLERDEPPGAHERDALAQLLDLGQQV